MTAILLTAQTFVALHGRIIEPGTTFACEQDYAKKLVAGGSAELKLRGNANSSDKNGENTSSKSAELQAKLEDLNVNMLKALAKKHSVELESDDKKAEIIEKIIASGVIIDETDV